MRHVWFAGCIVAVFAAVVAAQSDLPWTQLSRSTCAVEAFMRAHPDIDGRDVVIAVLDTGVDMEVPGLDRLPDGGVKVVDVQDFSGQGDVEIRRAMWNAAQDRIVHYADDGSPQFYTPPAGAAERDAGTVWFGVLNEKVFRNSAVPDINDNGETDDRIGLCVFSDPGGTDDDAVCYVDTDLDRDFSDETPLKNYKLAFDTFTFARPEKEAQIIPLTCAVNIFVSQRKVVIHYDDGGHGTHVAGIAAGYRIQGQPDFHGVAPGAKVISLKIGDNRLAGGSTTTGAKKRAFAYAARYAREHNVTVVCNLSYGIGSIREAHSDIDRFLDKLLRKNPDLIVCTSAGNLGPGISSVGTPAAARSAISVAALLAADTARDVLGVRIDAPQLTEFSSRGGELAKPDIATPGMTTSTVPRWNRRGDFWSGTSMASPYAAGLAALLSQYVRVTHAVAPRADWIKLALMNSAARTPGFTTLDDGAGVPNLVRAAALVDSIVSGHAADPLYGFKVETPCPFATDGESEAAYWRTRYYPTERPQAFQVAPVFVPTADATRITAFSKRLTIDADADWCRPLQDQVYFRGEQSATLRVAYDTDKLTEPGLYTATVHGREGDVVWLRLVNSIVVPHRAHADNDYEVRLDNQVVQGWKVRRHFVEVPAGASAMHVTLEAVDDQPSTARMRHIFRPDGRGIARMRLRLDTREDRRESHYTVNEELEPGIWEFPVTSARAEEMSAYLLVVRFDGVRASPESIDDLSPSGGRMASGKVELINVFDEPVHVALHGRVEGYRQTFDKTVTPDEDTAEMKLTLNPSIASVRVRVTMSDEDYAKVTDVPVNAYDSGGKAIMQAGMGEPELASAFRNPSPSADSTTVTLEIRPAFTHPDIEDEAVLDIVVDYLYAEPVDIDVKRGKASEVTLYPGVPTPIRYTLSRMPPTAPKKMKTIGYIEAVERRAKAPIARVEIETGS